MRALLLVLLAGCGIDFFDDKPIPQGIGCGDGGTCPPGQSCVTAEGVCRKPCKTAGDCDVNISCGENCNAQFVCDLSDGYCRPKCMNGGGDFQCMSCGGANSGSLCDRNGFCRTSCGPPLLVCTGSYVCSSLQDLRSCALCLPPDQVPDGGVGDLAGADLSTTDLAPVGSIARAGLSMPTLLARSGNQLFWSEGGQVNSCVVPNCSSVIPIGSTGNPVTALAAVSSVVVWATAAGDIVSCPSSGCPLPGRDSLGRRARCQRCGASRGTTAPTW